jgi:hypothetical protein
MKILGLKFLSCLGAIVFWYWGCPGAIAARLSDAPFASATAVPIQRLDRRIAKYPDWHQLQLEQHQGELTYPEWFQGRWVATSTLIEQIAPLAPALMTPGFEGNCQYLDRPIEFMVRFKPNDANLVPKVSPLQLPQLQISKSKPQIVADRSFNGFNIAAAYLGADNIKSVTVDPRNPTKQITQLAHDRQLVSFVTGFERELPTLDRFLAAEVSQQVFRGSATIYLNTVETTTSYHFSPLPTPKITATQISAIYLSPQDPDYFRARDLPVALYKYKLDLVRARA